MEEWRSVPGFGGSYEVSNHGRVRGLDRYIHCKNGVIKPVKGKILALKSARGYPCIRIQAQGKSCDFRINRLVARVFIPNPDNLSDVNHKDFDKLNNHIDNLEWMSQKDNTRHAYKAGKYTARTNPKAAWKLSQDLIFYIHEQWESGRSRKNIAKELDISHVTVWRVLRDKHWVKFKCQDG